jgi:hypothetical protein
MKKVRMVAGVALPAAAALAGAVPAQAAVAQGNAPPAPAVAAVTCPTTYLNSDTSVQGWWTGYVWGANRCAGYQEGVLWRQQTGLTERVRYRNSVNDLLYQARLGGTISAGATWFWSNHNLVAYICWQALVKNGTSTVINNGDALNGTFVP